MEGTSGLYETPATHLEANPGNGGPGDHDGGLRHLGVVRRNRARGLHCKGTSTRFKTLGSRVSAQTADYQAF